jgi:hypothetical protein
MYGLTQKELSKLGVALRHHKVQLSDTGKKGLRRWSMRLQLPEHAQWFNVVTALGHAKTWSNVNTALTFVKEVCPHTRTIQIVFESPS